MDSYQIIGWISADATLGGHQGKHANPLKRNISQAIWFNIL